MYCKNNLSLENTIGWWSSWDCTEDSLLEYVSLDSVEMEGGIQEVMNQPDFSAPPSPTLARADQAGNLAITVVCNTVAVSPLLLRSATGWNKKTPLKWRLQTRDFD